MSDQSATRFLQRLDSYTRAFQRLDELVTLITNSSGGSLFSNEETGLQTEIVSEALIKRFEFTQELSWNVLKDYLIYEGEQDVAASRDTYRRALRLGLINSPVWMDMITDRNLSAHDYNDTKAKEICERIVNNYYPLFKELLVSMQRRSLEITNNAILPVTEAATTGKPAANIPVVNNSVLNSEEHSSSQTAPENDIESGSKESNGNE